MKEGKALKAGMWYTVANFVTKGAVFLTMPLFTRLMDIQDIGIYSNITTWYSILLIVATFEFSTSLMVARFDYEQELDGYISSILVYGSVISILFYCVFLINFEWFCDFISVPSYALHIIMIYIIVSPALVIYQNMCRYQYNYKGVIISSLGTLLISTTLALILTSCCENKLHGRVFGYFLPYIVISGMIYLWYLYKGKGISFKYFKYAFALSFPMIGHLLASQILNASDKVIITKYLGTEANALYSVSYTCGMVILVLLASMNNAWAPWSLECMKDDRISELKKATKSYLLFFLFVALCFMLVAPEVLYLMGGTSYIEAKYVLPPVIIGYVCQFVYTLYVNAEFYLKQQKKIAYGTIFAAVLNLILNILLVPRFGYIVAAYTTLFGYFCLVLFHFISIKILGKLEWFDNKFQWFIICIGLMSVPIMNVLYRYTMVRYVIMGVVACIVIVVGYIKRSYLKELIHRVKK